MTAVAVAAVGPSASASVPSQGNAVQASAKKDIVETATAAGKFKTLTSLLKQAGLAGTLQGKGSYTVFAPTDAAFAKVPKATLQALGHDKAKLRSVLLYHVANGKLTAAKVVKRSSIKTLNGQRSSPRQRRQGHRRGRTGHHARRRRLQRGHPHHQRGADPALEPAAHPRPARSPRRAARARATRTVEDCARGDLCAIGERQSSGPIEAVPVASRDRPPSPRGDALPRRRRRVVPPVDRPLVHRQSPGGRFRRPVGAINPRRRSVLDGRDGTGR